MKDILHICMGLVFCSCCMSFAFYCKVIFFSNNWQFTLIYTLTLVEQTNNLLRKCAKESNCLNWIVSILMLKMQSPTFCRSNTAPDNSIAFKHIHFFPPLRCASPVREWNFIWIIRSNSFYVILNANLSPEIVWIELEHWENSKK